LTFRSSCSAAFFSAPRALSLPPASCTISVFALLRNARARPLCETLVGPRLARGAKFSPVPAGRGCSRNCHKNRIF
jgi:hypothetical protein